MKLAEDLWGLVASKEKEIHYENDTLQRERKRKLQNNFYPFTLFHGRN